MSSGFAVLAEFTVTPAAMPRFMDLVRRNAEASVRDEPGCRRFDVLTPESGGDRVVLYEIYDSPEAFDAHLTTPHYAAFRDAVEGMTGGVMLRRFILDEHAKRPT